MNTAWILLPCLTPVVVIGAALALQAVERLFLPAQPVRTAENVDSAHADNRLEPGTRA